MSEDLKNTLKMLGYGAIIGIITGIIAVLLIRRF